MKRPEWAQAKVRLGIATCWAAFEGDGGLTMCGTNWFSDALLWFSTAFFNYCVFPFCEEVPGFPIRVIEIYDEDLADQIEREL
jgi:hypothetical protein